MMWCWGEAVMFLVEVLAAMCALAICGPCFLACTRRLVIGDETLRRGPNLYQAEVLGCNEPGCPYYKKNFQYLMVPAFQENR